MLDNVKAEVKKRFESLDYSVTLAVFIQKIECRYCAETRSLIEQVASLSQKIGARVFDFEDDKDAVEKYRIDKIPAVVVEGKKD